MTPEEQARFDKALRYFEACDKLDGLKVPSILMELEASGELGRELAGLCWTTIAQAIEQSTGKKQTPPNTSRTWLVKLCGAALRRRARAN